MRAVVIRIAIRLALCALLGWLGWRVLGPGGLLAGGVLLGLALPKPLLDLASELKGHTRERVWRDVEGRHFAYHGRPLHVLHDESHCRWVRAADVRRIVGYTASDGALALTYPNGYRVMGNPPLPHFSDEALIAHLAKEAGPKAIRFKNWAEREISFPARRLRKRYGIRLEAPTFEPDD